MARLDTLMSVRELPWKGLGTEYDSNPSTMEELVSKAKLNWDVGNLPMVTDLHGKVFNYNAIYRKDNQHILGVVNKAYPQIVQNSEMFNAFQFMLGSAVDVDTVSSFDGGNIVFGSFKIHEQYKILDDEFDHYFVVVNDHLKVDGKISVLNTPVRIICKNTLERAMHKNFYHLRVPVGDVGINRSTANTILGSVKSAIDNTKSAADRLINKKVDDAFIDKLMDEFFPFTKVEGESIHNRANEAVQMVRDTFTLDCLGAPDISNYKGTLWWIYNGLTDFSQHYFKNIDHAYDLGHRMKRLSGVGVPSEPNKVDRFLKIVEKLP